MEPSPYLPTSRRFVNPLYLRVEDIHEFGDLAPAAAESGRAALLRRTREASTCIDRDTAWAPSATR